MKIREIFMPDYKKMYTTLFNAVTDAIISIQQNNHVTAKNILIQAQQEAEGRNGAAYREKDFKYSQAGQQERHAQDLRNARTELNKATDRAEKRDLQGEVNALVKEARRAAKSKDDTTDDTAAFRAISNFLKKQGDEVEQYGVNVKALIAVCEKLNMGADKSQGRIKALERDLKSLQRKVDRTNSGQ